MEEMTTVLFSSRKMVLITDSTSSETDFPVLTI